MKITVRIEVHVQNIVDKSVFYNDFGVKNTSFEVFSIAFWINCIQIRVFYTFFAMFFRRERQIAVQS